MYLNPCLLLRSRLKCFVLLYRALEKIFKSDIVAFEGNWLFSGPKEIPYSDGSIWRSYN